MARNEEYDLKHIIIQGFTTNEENMLPVKKLKSKTITATYFPWLKWEGYEQNAQYEVAFFLL